MKKKVDVIIRDCGEAGYIGIIEEGGKEIYRTQMFYITPYECFYKVYQWLQDNEI